MRTNTKKINLSVVIASLGEDVIFKTINALNNGKHIPYEIIVSVPKSTKEYIILKKIRNVKILKSPTKGQVIQRLYGLNITSQELVLQMDDDTILSSSNMNKLFVKLKELGSGNAISPLIYDIDHNKSITVIKKNLSNLFNNIFNFILARSKWGTKKMGTIAPSGVAYGLDADHISNTSLIKRDYIPGCCLMMFKKDLILKNYYPFDGKAYFEDVIHSILLRKKNVKLWTFNKTICNTKMLPCRMNLEEIKKHFEAQKYCVQLLKNNLSSFYIWMFFYRPYLIIKYFTSIYLNKK